MKFFYVHTMRLEQIFIHEICMKRVWKFHVWTFHTSFMYENLFQTNCMYIQKFHTYFHTFHTYLSWLGLTQSPMSRLVSLMSLKLNSQIDLDKFYLRSDFYKTWKSQPKKAPSSFLPKLKRFLKRDLSKFSNGQFK